MLCLAPYYRWVVTSTTRTRRCATAADGSYPDRLPEGNTVPHGKTYPNPRLAPVAMLTWLDTVDRGLPRISYYHQSASPNIARHPKCLPHLNADR